MKTSFPSRLESIDVFRAITMLLMIFVNDLWSLTNVPNWLLHAPAQDDAMGLSDVVFPVFLFIIGLSIPFAIQSRMVKGASFFSISLHILERSFALLVMGVFIVNFENIMTESMILPKYAWEVLMVVAFALVWNLYPRNPEKQILFRILKALGYGLLLFLAYIYKGGEAGHLEGMKTHWWGILGLLGWSYLVCAFAYLLLRKSEWLLIGFWIFLVLFNFADFSKWLTFLDDLREHVWIVGSGSLPAFTMAGVVCSVLYTRYGSKKNLSHIFILILLGLGVICLIYGFGTRPLWGISKIRATPAWVGICSGISLLFYAGLFWIIDINGGNILPKWLRPAGTATLTCYLVPYLFYAIILWTNFTLPEFLTNGIVGLVKSLTFAVVVVLFTGWLNKAGIKLKI